MLSLVRTFGAFVAVTVTSLRKALSVVISFVIFRYVSKVGILKSNIYLYGSAKISAVHVFLLSVCSMVFMVYPQQCGVILMRDKRCDMSNQSLIQIVYLSNQLAILSPA